MVSILLRSHLFLPDAAANRWWHAAPHRRPRSAARRSGTGSPWHSLHHPMAPPGTRPTMDLSGGTGL